MIVTCEKRLFDLFLAAKGSWLTLKGDDLDFLYLALGEGMDFSDRTLINILAYEIFQKSNRLLKTPC